MKTKKQKTKSKRALPKVVSREEWQKARNKLLRKEKAATRAHDKLAAERRRLPMVKVEKDYAFDGPNGRASLLDLFEGRRQLILYHFMFAPGVDGWPAAGCPGCSMVVDYIGPLAHCTPAIRRSLWFRGRHWPTSKHTSGAWVGPCPGFPPRAPTSTGTLA
jgi:predicted dithiol-disulfide oxidoreductase (DUF899 family)